MVNILFDVEHLLRTYSYAGVFVVVFLESGIFFALPGDSLLFTAGLLASVASLKIYILIPAIFLATFLGGLAGYQVGVYLEHLKRYRILRWILKPEYIEKAHEFFVKHGKSAILLSRFVPLMRTFAPIVAGIARMPHKKFVRYSLISSFLWSTSITLLGYFLGRAVPQVKDYLGYFIIAVVLVSIAPGAVHYVRMRREHSHTT